MCLAWIRFTCVLIIKMGFGTDAFNIKNIRKVEMRHVSIKLLCFQAKNLTRNKFIYQERWLNRADYKMCNWSSLPLTFIIFSHFYFSLLQLREVKTRVLMNYRIAWCSYVAPRVTSAGRSWVWSSLWAICFQVLSFWIFSPACVETVLIFCSFPGMLQCIIF